MKKHLLWALTAFVMLGACNKNDDPTPDPVDPVENQSTKKIKEVQISFLKQERGGVSFTLTNATISYEYDAEGRISKIINKEDGQKDEIIEVTYPNGKIGMKSEKEHIEYPLNNKGHISGFEDLLYFYDDKGQLNKADSETYSWENGNLTKVIDVYQTTNETNVSKITYYPNENKNKFLIHNFGGNLVNAYLGYFNYQKALPVGVPTKNLVKIFEKTYEHTSYGIGSTTSTTSFEYMYDADGYVTNIVENRKGNERIGSSSGTPYIQNLKELEQLMANIDNGTVKNKTYKVHENANGVYRFDITHNYHITQDTNGKAIDVKYAIHYFYRYEYTETNGVRTYTNAKEIFLDERDASTSYKIIYE